MERLALILTIGIATVALYACEDTLIDAEPAPQPSLAGEQPAPSGGFRFPEGTAATIISDESGREFIRFQLPEGHRLVGRVDPSAVETAVAAAITAGTSRW